MNRREFFRRTVPVVAVTVAAVASGQTTSWLRRALERIRRWLDEESRQELIIRQLNYQSQKAINAMMAKISEYLYDYPTGVFA